MLEISDRSVYTRHVHSNLVHVMCITYRYVVCSALHSLQYQTHKDFLVCTLYDVHSDLDSKMASILGVGLRTFVPSIFIESSIVIYFSVFLCKSTS